MTDRFSGIIEEWILKFLKQLCKSLTDPTYAHIFYFWCICILQFTKVSLIVILSSYIIDNWIPTSFYINRVQKKSKHHYALVYDSTSLIICIDFSKSNFKIQQCCWVRISNKNRKTITTLLTIIPYERIYSILSIMSHLCLSFRSNCAQPFVKHINLG